MSSPSERSSALRGRFWIACILVLPANLIWCVWTLSVNPSGPWFDEFPLLANAVVLLLAFVGLNALFRRWRPSWAFSSAELLLLYTTLAVSTAVSGSCYGQGLGITIAYPFWFGDVKGPGRAIADWHIFLPHLPTWLVVQDPEALRGFWSGHSSFYQIDVLMAWAMPLLAWSGFIVVFFFGTMCLNVLLRRYWVVHERLTFPIVWLPVEMTRPSGQLFRSRLLWAGFVLAAVPPLINGLAYLHPGTIIPIGGPQWMTYLSFPDAPWNAMDSPTVSFDPMVIGFGFLLPLDLLFSSWFFHLYWQLQRVLAAAAGFSPQEQRFPYVLDQSYGGVLALGVLAVWGTRKSLLGAWRRAWSRRDRAEVQASEALSERTAFVGLGLSLAAVMVFMRWTGMSVVLAVLLPLLVVIALVALTRIRAESGGPLLPMTGCMNPALNLTRLVGTRAFSAKELTVMSIHHWYVDSGFNQPMPYGMEALKMAAESRRVQRRFFIAAVAAAMIGMVGTLLVEMHFAYRLGEAAGFHKAYWAQTDTWTRLSNWIEGPTGSSAGSALGMLAGAALTTALAVLRVRFVGWPFHPVPFVVTAGVGYLVGFFWLPFLIAWVIKLLILRYWGRPGFHAALPFFFGLILGEMTGGMFWPLYGMLTGTRCYSFFGV